jgi:hypothetical protein
VRCAQLEAELEEIRSATARDLATARNLIAFYGCAIPAGAAQKVDGKEDGDCLSVTARIWHLRWMLGEMQGMEDLPKLNRWLGFVQGVMYTSGLCSIDDLRRHATEAKA